MQQPIIAQPYAQQQSSNAVVVFGIPLQDAETAKKVNRVVVCAGLTAAMTVIVAIIGFAETSLPTYLTNAAFGLSVTACGYFGAKNKNQGLVGAFICCNLCVVITSIFVAIVLIVSVSWVGSIANQVDLASMSECCDMLSKEDFDPTAFCQSPSHGNRIYAASSGHMCEEAAGEDPAEAGQCYSFIEGSSTALCCVDGNYCDEIQQFQALTGHAGATAMYSVAALALVGAVPACIACIFGYNLYNSPTYFAIQPTGYMGAPVVMPVTTQQQQYMQQQQQPVMPAQAVAVYPAQPVAGKVPTY